ncbi:Hypothetical protein CINCED_3A018295 [Cinara cedri]|uniref:Uncharacterized protein n=1 Tax=Cinara cedri TaxID=506608 RepID=A0A5E4MTB6_9HEMI|nr:Hypothetical protein CINCED_3A018295 [Cinara cedri]
MDKILDWRLVNSYHLRSSLRSLITLHMLKSQGVRSDDLGGHLQNAFNKRQFWRGHFGSVTNDNEHETASNRNSATSSRNSTSLVNTFPLDSQRTSVCKRRAESHMRSPPSPDVDFNNAS